MVLKIGFRNVDAMQFGGDYLFHLTIPFDVARISGAGALLINLTWIRAHFAWQKDVTDRF
jgi:hypothetical protein